MSNRLEKEDSPYLQQYKDSPVDWWPWCDEALEKAQNENKAIFISIGYSSCHWCHVMAENVFKNKECADILNDGFICIKVDKEERPDIDKYFQNVHQLLNNRSGGWPTSIFCTPQNKPFFASTYMEADSKGTSIEEMGFKELTKLIHKRVSKNDASLYKNADEVESFIGKITHPTEATILKEDFTKNFMLQAKNNYQPKYGGFSVAPKFPHASTLNALLYIDELYDDKSARSMFLDTLDKMSKGGFYDLVDGGFSRYSIDEKWLVTHFEKMLYDNALLCEIYAKSYMKYKKDAHLKIAKESADFWYNFMSEDELFYSSSDADFNENSGAYFTYTYEELHKAFIENGLSDVETLLEKLSVTQQGNFETRNIIRIEDNTHVDNFDEIKIVLQNIRKTRVYPFCDKKVQTSWSAMMINSLYTLGSIDSKYTTIATKCLDKLLETMFIDNQLYHTTLIHKTPKVTAFLEDYAYLSQALISAYKATQNEMYLINAQRFANKALEEFYDRGSWNFSAGEFVTKAEATDNIYTSEISIMIEALLSLSTLLKDDKYAHFAFKTMEYNSYELGRKAIYYPHMLVQMLRYIKD